MKTAISIPDDTFAAAERRAKQLGMSRSQFFTSAAQHYLEQLDRSSLTQQVNEALDAVPVDDSAAAAAAAGRALLAASDEW